MPACARGTGRLCDARTCGGRQRMAYDSLMRLRQIPAIVALIATVPAGATCTLKAVPAVVCVHPKVAADMWHQVGFDRRIAADSNNQQLVGENQCVLFTLPEFRQHPITLAGAPWRVATTKGWVAVRPVSVPQVIDGVWIAEAYLHATCTKGMPRQTPRTLPWQQIPEYAARR